VTRTRGWGGGGGGGGVFRVTVAGSTADGLALAELGGDDGRGAAAAVHPASTQHPASALAASAYLTIPTDMSASTLSALGYAKMKPQPTSLLAALDALHMT
jgi:hypothetical protein